MRVRGHDEQPSIEATSAAPSQPEAAYCDGRPADDPSGTTNDASQRTTGGPGTDESVWDEWLGANPLDVIEADALVPNGQRVVVIAPHPDDEVLGVGSLLAAYAALGRDVQVVAVTDGDASHPHSRRWTPLSLAAARRHESATGWLRLGLPPGVGRRLGFADGGLAKHADALAERLAAGLVSGDCVFSTWRLDGHPDHEATGRAAAIACARRGCTLIEYPVWMWHWARPGDPRVPWHRLRRLRSNPDLLARKRHAVQAHVSQLEADDAHPWPVLPAAAVEGWLGRDECVFIPAAP